MKQNQFGQCTLEYLGALGIGLFFFFAFFGFLFSLGKNTLCALYTFDALQAELFQSQPRYLNFFSGNRPLIHRSRNGVRVTHSCLQSQVKYDSKSSHKNFLIREDPASLKRNYLEANYLEPKELPLKP